MRPSSWISRPKLPPALPPPTRPPARPCAPPARPPPPRAPRAARHKLQPDRGHGRDRAGAGRVCEQEALRATAEVCFARGADRAAHAAHAARTREGVHWPPSPPAPARSALPSVLRVCERAAPLLRRTAMLPCAPTPPGAAQRQQADRQGRRRDCVRADQGEGAGDPRPQVSHARHAVRRPRPRGCAAVAPRPLIDPRPADLCRARAPARIGRAAQPQLDRRRRSQCPWRSAAQAHRALGSVSRVRAVGRAVPCAPPASTSAAPREAARVQLPCCRAHSARAARAALTPPARAPAACLHRHQRQPDHGRRLAAAHTRPGEEPHAADALHSVRAPARRVHAARGRGAWAMPPACREGPGCLPAAKGRLRSISTRTALRSDRRGRVRSPARRRTNALTDEGVMEIRAVWDETGRNNMISNGRSSDAMPARGGQRGLLV